MISLYTILKEVIETTPEYYHQVEKIKQQGGKLLGSGEYGAAFLVGNRVVKVTTDSEELEDAQKIKGIRTKYFVYIYDVEVINSKLGIITMEDLEQFTADPDEIPIDDIMAEADELDIYPDLEGPGGKIKLDNVMQDRSGNVKIIDV
jgi:hypothetical protein